MRVDSRIPPKTHCPDCGRPVRTGWTPEGDKILLGPTARRDGPLVVADTKAGRRIIRERRSALFVMQPGQYGYDRHDCKVEAAIEQTYQANGRG